MTIWTPPKARYLLSALLASTASFGASCPKDPLAGLLLPNADPKDPRIHITAEEGENAADKDHWHFHGQVHATQGNKNLFANDLMYSPEALATQGPTQLGLGNIALSGRDAHYALKPQRLKIRDADYFLEGGRSEGHGHAQTVDYQVGANHGDFSRVWWSRCPGNNPTWSLSARTMELKDKKAILHGAIVRIKGIPVAYLPSYTVSSKRAAQRRSGFLLPRLDYSAEQGWSYAQPYYFNIAPNMDATLTPHEMTVHGLMWEGQARYLGPHSKAVVAGSWLFSDHGHGDADRNITVKSNAPKAKTHKISAEAEQTRWSQYLDYELELAPSWKLNLLWQNVSDLNFADDFTRQLSFGGDFIRNGLAPLDRKWFLERHLTIDGATDWGNFGLRFQTEQRISPNVDATATPYQRFPEWTWRKDGDTHGLFHHLDFAHTHFVHPEARPDAPDGWRSQFNAQLGVRFDAGNFTLTPSLLAYYRHLSLDQDNKEEDNPSLFLNGLSFDAQYHFEYNFEAVGSRWRQTLTPRFHYLYIPYEAQNTPLFDSADRGFGWDYLFANNRFVGGDRIGDTQQFTYALTGQLADADNGRDIFHFSLGQIRYLEPRRVQLDPKAPAADDDASPLILNARWNFTPNWGLSAKSQWQTLDWTVKRGSLGARYARDGEHFLGVNWLWDDANTYQFTGYARWTFDDVWHFAAKEQFSLSDNVPMNTVLGLSYQNCCSNIGFAYRNYRNDPSDEETQSAYYLTFALDGLFHAGNHPERMLNREINPAGPIALP